MILPMAQERSATSKWYTLSWFKAVLSPLVLIFYPANFQLTTIIFVVVFFAAIAFETFQLCFFLLCFSSHLFWFVNDSWFCSCGTFNYLKTLVVKYALNIFHYMWFQILVSFASSILRNFIKHILIVSLRFPPSISIFTKYFTGFYLFNFTAHSLNSIFVYYCDWVINIEQFVLILSPLVPYIAPKVTSMSCYYPCYTFATWSFMPN